MAAAVAAKEQGVSEVILLERHEYLGGVLPQCIHNGFGTQLYDTDYTGGEYAWLWKQKAEDAGVDIRTGTTVLSVEKGWEVRCVSASAGAETLTADAVVIATGCRERTLPQMLIPGSRPAGIMTAGAAQLMMNMKNYLPGKSAVILGSGDIGLIMARRMTLEGIHVKMILGQHATGLARNIVQCVEDYDIPMRYGWTAVSTHGYRRLTGVTIAPFGEDGKPDISRKEYIRCDTLLIAAGLIPELEVCRGLDFDEPGLFICGNANGVHDLADHVTEEGIITGQLAAAYLGCGAAPDGQSSLHTEDKGKTGNMVCTVCPKSCIMNVVRDPFAVSGNQCDRGETFALQELENPKRVLTTIVRTDRGTVSVRTSQPIDKRELFTAMKAISKLKVQGAVEPGQTVAVDIAGLGVDLVATWYE